MAGVHDMAGWFGADREISRERHDAAPEQVRPAEEHPYPGKPREAGARLYAVVDNSGGAAAAVRETSGAAPRADAEGDRPEAGAAVGAPGKSRLNLLGVVALGLWILAVALGIAAPLLGVAVDFRLVVGVLVASGVVSLLSLPLTALSSDRKDSGKP